MSGSASSQVPQQEAFGPKANFDGAALDNFANSDFSKAYTKEQIALLKSQTYVDPTGKYYLAGGNKSFDVNGLVSAFNVFQQNATKDSANYASYQKLAAAQPGRSATILTGAASDPNPSILGGLPQIGIR